MLSQVLAHRADSRRSNLFWAAIAALMLSQLVAFYLLCSAQVQKAQQREAAVFAQRMAVSDCLHAADSTIGGCANRAVLHAGSAAPADGAGGRETEVTAQRGSGVMTSLVPVGFTFR